MKQIQEVLHELGRHKRAIALVGDAPPIKFSPAPLVQACPLELSRAANKETPYVIDLQTAEAQYKSVGAEKPTGSTRYLDQHAVLFQLQTGPADEFEEDRAQQGSQDAIVDDQSLEV